MLSITHIVVTLLLIQIMNLDRNDAFVAMLFGVFIDLDHLFGLVNYTHVNGVASVFDFHTMLNPGGSWKSILHAPIAAAVVVPLSFAFRLAVPLIFWSAHLLMDNLGQNFLGNFSSLEAGLLLFTGLGLVTLRYGKYIMGTEAASFSAYLRSEIVFARHAMRPRPRPYF